MVKRNARRKSGKKLQPSVSLSKRLQTYYLLGSTLLGSSAIGLAQQATPSAPRALPPGYRVVPVNHTFAEHPGGDNVDGVSQEYDVVINSITAFKFHTYYANVFNPAVSNSWQTIQVWVNPVAEVTNTIYTKDWAGNRMVSHACDSAMIADSPSGPGIRGNHGWDYDGTTNFLAFYRKSVTSVCDANGNCFPRTLIYSDGHFGRDGAGNGPAGAIPIYILPTVLEPAGLYGWINVVLEGHSTALTIVDVVYGPNNNPVHVEGADASGCTGSTQAPLGNAPFDVETNLSVPSAKEVLQLPLPDGTVPLTLGLLAKGEEGMRLWRRAQSVKRNFLETGR